ERETLLPDLSLAIQMGRYFIRLIKPKPGFAASLSQLISDYPLSIYEPDKNDDDGIQLLNTVTGRVFDGFSFYKAIMTGSVSAAIVSNYPSEIEAFKSWYQRSYSQPDDAVISAWLPSQLEYQFAVSA